MNMPRHRIFISATIYLAIKFTECVKNPVASFKTYQCAASNDKHSHFAFFLIKINPSFAAVNSIARRVKVNLTYNN